MLSRIFSNSVKTSIESLFTLCSLLSKIKFAKPFSSILKIILLVDDVIKIPIYLKKISSIFALKLKKMQASFLQKLNLGIRN